MTGIIRNCLLIGLLAAPAGAELFPYQDGWLGADAAYSIPINESTTLWLFGDTFVGKERAPQTMIHNSIAIRSCHKGDCRVTYWWTGMHTQRDSAFFQTTETDYFWPLDGFAYKDKLYIFLEQMHATGAGGAFGFDYSQIMLATISNIAATPSFWKISYSTIAKGGEVVPGIATVIPAHQTGTQYVFVFTLFRQLPSAPICGLLRLPLAELAHADETTKWEYLATGSKWRVWGQSTAPADALKLLDGNITEMSVVYHPDAAKWLAVYPTPGFLSKAAAYSTASELGGPWTESRRLFEYPEMQKNDPSYTPHVFCYAAKEHPELEKKGEIDVTYACNSTDEQEIFRDLRLYRPELEHLCGSGGGFGPFVLCGGGGR